MIITDLLWYQFGHQGNKLGISIKVKILVLEQTYSIRTSKKTLLIVNGYCPKNKLRCLIYHASGRHLDHMGQNEPWLLLKQVNPKPAP